jgi:hypothetical protein
MTVVHRDSDGDPKSPSFTTAALETMKGVVSVPENELRRWKRIFDANAKIVVDGEKLVLFAYTCKCAVPSNPEFSIACPCRFLDSDSFVNAIAPTGEFSKIGRAQFAILFRVADVQRRGLVGWDDFCVFETSLKRPDADYFIAFKYFDVYVSCFVLIPGCLIECTETILGQLHMMNLEMSSWQTLDLMPSLLILIGNFSFFFFLFGMLRYICY